MGASGKCFIDDESNEVSPSAQAVRERRASVTLVEMASAGQDNDANFDNSIILGVVVVDFVRCKYAYLY